VGRKTENERERMYDVKREERRRIREERERKEGRKESYKVRK